MFNCPFGPPLDETSHLPLPFHTGLPAIEGFSSILFSKYKKSDNYTYVDKDKTKELITCLKPEDNQISNYYTFLDYSGDHYDLIKFDNQVKFIYEVIIE